MNFKNMEKDHFDKIANSYDKDFEDFPSFHYIETVLNYLKSHSSYGLILEVGAGTGTFTKGVINKRNKIISSDLSRQMILKSKEKNNFRQIDFLQCDVEHLPFNDGLFDQVFCVGLLHHMIFLPNSYFTAIDEMIRVLKDGGGLIIVEPNWSNIFQKLSYYTFFKRGTTSSREKPIYLPEILEYTSNKKLKLEVVETFTFLPRMTPNFFYKATLPLQEIFLRIFKKSGRVFLIKATK